MRKTNSLLDDGSVSQLLGVSTARHRPFGPTLPRQDNGQSASHEGGAPKLGDSTLRQSNNWSISDVSGGTACWMFGELQRLLCKGTPSVTAAVETGQVEKPRQTDAVLLVAPIEVLLCNSHEVSDARTPLDSHCSGEPPALQP